MAVLVTADVHGQTQQGYDGMRGMLEPELKLATGFISHVAFATDEGWRVLEIWESAAHANRFFADHVHPHLPPGIRPRRTFQALHSLVRA